MTEKEKVKKTEEDWKEFLTEKQFQILREKGTEQPFTGELLHNKAKGKYKCAGCGEELFLSDTKFDSGSGWPSFWEASEDDNIETRSDDSLGMRRTEILCRKCGGHLGHVFDDGPNPTGKRFCVNSVSLKFEEE
jgi:peptide-methionine (R)-S-oxide reductase